MNLANRLTSLRIILSPVFFIAYSMLNIFPDAKIPIIILLWVLFIVIELSDFFDGIVARARKETSDFGKLLDPWADSVSRLTYFICFTQEGLLPFWILIILIYRDLFTSFIRMYFSTKGIVHGSKMTGKIKAWVYAFAGIFGLILISLKKLLIFVETYGSLLIVTNVIFLLCVFIAVVTIADYSSVFWKKKNQKNY